ncbi:hypothetical protein B0H15DRAFT_890496 [Mycena belliarum]|uniref:Uncharacterized protein n=1 Tax=Mycena belliarum TaxID=1033014 RepID=A0AAD6XM72_9AGAR|nr:hypothetical protein B0H15DRAFT_890496 [Mycena belliae]
MQHEDLESAHEDLEESGEEGTLEEGSDHEGSISSYSESENPDRSFDPMPSHLALPPELHRLVLSQESTQFQLMWGTYRFVCKAWKEHIEYLARTEWIQTAAFDYPGYMIRDAEENKVFLSGFFEFRRMDGDTAVFDTSCAPEYHKRLVQACKRTAPPDVQVCGFVHDVPITGMTVDWDALTLSCPWRAVVARVLSEELHVEAYRARTNKAMMTEVKRMRADPMFNLEAAFRLFGAHVHGAYEAVRKERLGRTDKAGDERLKHARVAASYRLLERDESSGEEEENEKESDGDDEEDSE